MFHVGSHRITYLRFDGDGRGDAGCMWVLTCKYICCEKMWDVGCVWLHTCGYDGKGCGMLDVCGYLPVGMMVKGVVCGMFVVTYLWV